MKTKFIQYLQLLLFSITIILLGFVLFKQYSFENKINKIGAILTQNIMNNSQNKIREGREVDIKIDGNYSIGEENAPVTIVMFSDYQCGYCKKFFDEVFPKVQDEFISKGIVKFVIRDFPIETHKDAFLAAKIAKCAQKQGKFFEMHQLLLDNQQDISLENFSKWSSQIGLNIDSANICIDDPVVISAVNNDLKDVKKVEIPGTPAFVINNKLYTGAKPFEKFKELILQEVRKKQRTL